MSELETVHTVAPQALERARRLDYALRLIRQGMSRREVSGMVRRRFECSQPTAWRLVDMANDMAGRVK